jgi:hypothetical protein
MTTTSSVATEEVRMYAALLIVRIVASSLVEWDQTVLLDFAFV